MKQLAQMSIEGNLTTALPSFNGEQIGLCVDKQLILYTPVNGQLQPTGLAYSPYMSLPDNSWLCTSWSEDRRIAHLQPDGSLQLHDSVGEIMSAHPFPKAPAEAIIVESESVRYEFNTGYYELTVKHPVTKAVVAKISPCETYSINRDGSMLLVGVFDLGEKPVASRYELYRAPNWVKLNVPCENPLTVKFLGNKDIMAVSRNGTITVYDPLAS